MLDCFAEANAGIENDLVNPQANKCVDIPSANTANGNRLQIWTCNGTAAQKWTL